MDLTVMLRAVRRQWWVVAAVLVLTAVLAVLTMGAFPPTYTVEGEYLLAQGELPEAREPTTSAAVIAAVVDSRGFGESPPDPFDEVQYDVAPVEGASVITVSTAAESSSVAVEGVDRLVTTIEEVVSDLARPGSGPAASRVVLLGRSVQTTGGEPSDEEEPEGAFRATATVQIVAPERPQPTYGPTDYTATVLTSLLGAPRNVDSYLGIDGIDEFQITTDTRSSAPIVTLSVSGTDRETVLDAYDRAEEQLQEELADAQADEVARGAVPTTADALTRPDGPTLIENNVRRPLAVVVLLGVFIALAAALAVDAYREQRRGPRAAPPAVITQSADATTEARASSPREREAVYYAARNAADDGTP